ncbi:unnamed protein product, partial [Effrenium voratum]
EGCEILALSFQKKDTGLTCFRNTGVCLPQASMSRAASPEPEVTSLTHRGQLFQARFTNVKRRGRSLSPPAREHATASWRGPDHIPVTCVIKRRRQKKGPKEKLLILPFVASEADTRFSHLFETL